jgi:hypothetical protein
VQHNKVEKMMTEEDRPTKVMNLIEEIPAGAGA